MPRYLVIQLARFGDVVQSKRLIYTLLARGEVHLCVDAGLKDLAELVYPEAMCHTLPVHGACRQSAFSAIHRCTHNLSALKFDAVYNLNHSGLNRALARAFDPERVHGYAMYGAQVVLDPWIRKAFRWTQQRTIAPLNLMDFWAYFDADPIEPQHVHPVAQGKGQGMGVVLAGRESRRSLPPSVLAQYVHTAFEVLDAPDIYLLGSKAERPLAQQFLRSLPGNVLTKVHNLCGKTDWRGLKDALCGLDVVLTPDTGTMHLAAHLGVPVQAFFLSSAWCHETGPYGLGHTVWQAMSTCTPCLESAPCSIDVACLRSFTHKAVIRAFAQQLDTTHRAPWNMTQSRDFPDDIMCYASCLDALGSAWHCTQGQDVYAEQRNTLRHLVAYHCGVAAAMSPLHGHYDENMLSMIYDDTDWMLPHAHTMEDII